MAQKTFLLKTVIVFLTVLLTSACSDNRVRPTAPVELPDEIVEEECGACHQVFQSQMLPSATWEIITDDLENHFGEDASLDDETVAHIQAYLVAHSATTVIGGGKFLWGTDAIQLAFRITETPYWEIKHRGVDPDGGWEYGTRNSKSNCTACHDDELKGNYDKD